MNALELRAALALAAVYMFRMLGLFMVLPVIAVSAISYSDYSPFLVGLAIGGYGLMQAILQIPMGTLSDRWGRKPVIIMGLSVFVLGSVVAAQADSMAELVIGRFLQGGGAIASAIMALATDVSREKARPYVMATIGIAIGFSFYLAVLVGPAITSAFGLPGIFWFTAAAALASMPMIIFLVPNPVKSIASLDIVPRKAGVVRLFTTSQLWRLNVNVMLLHLCITLLFVPLPYLLQDIGFDLSEHWQVYLPVLLIAIVGLVALMMLSRKGHEKLAVILACVCMMAGLLTIGLSTPTFWLLIFAATLFFSGFNFLEATFPTMVSRLAPAGEKGSAMGLYASFQFSGAFLGGVIAGTILSFTSAQWVFLSGVVLCILMLCVSVKLRPAKKVSRIALSPANKVSAPDSVLESLLALEGVVEAQWSQTQDVVHLKITEQFDPNAANNVLNPS